MDNQKNNNSGSACGYKSGPLPGCAPLATSRVPVQQDDMPKYGNDNALTRGTLFPGLDLPFKNIANETNPYSGTPLGELMALQFVIQELRLYLDTHPDDVDTFKALKETIVLECEGRRRFSAMYGPIDFSDLQYSDSYTWPDDPWPWNYNERTGKN